MRKTLFTFSVAALIFAVAMQIFGAVAHPPGDGLERPLVDMLAAEVDGWSSSERPVADTESLRDWTERLLQYDDAVFRIYRRGPVEVGIYIAYWSPGKKPYAMVGAHNPDSCWVNAGWDRLGRDYSQERSVGGRPLKPCEFGVFAKDGQRTDVIFWHLVGGRANRYEEQKVGWRNGLVARLERLPFYWQDFRLHGFDQRREQFFVRLSSNVSLDEIWADEAFRDLLRALEPFGVFAAEPTPGTSPAGAGAPVGRSAPAGEAP